ncbi:MAG: helix-turn-helix transcriptional regulator [Gammaproteobacteria bacterium]
MKRSHALVYLRQLCCSGLQKELVISEFLRTLPQAIPSNSNTFSGCDALFNPTYHLCGTPEPDTADFIPAVISAFFNHERRSRTRQWFAGHDVLDNPLAIDERFYMSDMYNLVYRPFDMHHVLWTQVTVDAKHAGMLCSYRSTHQKPFARREQDLFNHLANYVSHALKATGDQRVEYGDIRATGMLLMDAGGKVLFQSPEAKHLMAAACRPSLNGKMGIGQDKLAERLVRLCANMRAIRLGRDVPPPVYCHTGPMGQFVFRAYRLDGCDRQPEGLIGVSVEHREPLALKILQALRESPLSPTQKEVALWLAQGLALEKICSRLHIKPTTLKDHIGKIYLKLDIHRREDLLPKLLGISIKVHERHGGSVATLN